MLEMLLMRLAAAVALAAALQAEGGRATEVRAYPIGLLDLEAAVRLVRTLLSPEGVAVEDRGHHRVIVSDRPDVHARVAAALRGLDTPARNVRIRVTHDAERLDERTLLEGSAGASAGGVRVGVGRHPPSRGVEVTADASRSRTTAKTEQEIVVLSGGRAEIAVTEQVPYADWFWSWGQAQGLWTPAVQWRDVGASLVVEPIALGDGRVRVRVTPAFGYWLDRARQVTEVHQLTTEVVVREGEPIDLGGLPMSDREFRDRFLVGLDQGGTRQRVRITLRARVD
jgi:type II secretory pathway component GspD/PulD (secretin)